MKYLLKNVALATMLLCFFNCTTESIDITDSQQLNNEETPTTMTCSGETPKAKIINNGTVNVNLEIFDDAGGLVNSVYNLAPGEVSSWKTFPEGFTTFVVVNNTSQKEITIEMATCMIFEMTIGANNQLTSDQPEQL